LKPFVVSTGAVASSVVAAVLRRQTLAAGAALALLGLLTCGPADAPEEGPPPIRPVRVVTVEELPGGETVTLTGNVQAQDDVAWPSGSADN
jgi:multidrug efflux pump subunit AcrA (membrane-fusion protein)